MLGCAAADMMNKITPADISDPLEVVARVQTPKKPLGSGFWGSGAGTSCVPGY